MFDAKQIGTLIGKDNFQAINASNLPKLETMTLLHIWMQGSKSKLRILANNGELLPQLKRQYRQGLEQAAELRMNNAHLTQTECLQAAGLPLTL